MNSVEAPMIPAVHVKKVAVTGLPRTFDLGELERLFSGFGPLETFEFPMHESENDGYPEGYGYVTYRNAGDAENAIRNLNNFKLDKTAIKVSYALDFARLSPRSL